MPLPHLLYSPAAIEALGETVCSPTAITIDEFLNLEVLFYSYIEGLDFAYELFVLTRLYITSV